MLLFYPFFFRTFGAWKTEYMVTPRMFPMEELSLPRNSAYHILPDTGETATPNPQEHVLTGWKKPISLNNIIDMTRKEGMPRRLAYDVVGQFNKFLTANNTQFRRWKSIELTVPDDQALVAISYCALPKLFYYPETNYSEWNKYYNTLHTVLSTAEALANVSSRHQFIILDAPQLVPSLELLRHAERAIEVDRKITKDFNTPGRRLVLELFKWMGAGYSKSSIFALISLKNLDKINLVIRYDNKFALLNLGLVFSWRSAPKTEEDVWEHYGKVAGKGQVPAQFQRWLIRFFAAITNTESISADIAVLDSELKAAGETVIEDPKEVNTVQNTPTTILTKMVDSKLPQSETNSDLDEDLDEEELDQDPALDDFKLSPDLEKELEAELAILERKNAKYGEDQEEKPVSEVAPIEEINAPTIYNAVALKADYLADQGVLSAAEYKRHLKLSESYKKIQINGQSVEELINIPIETAVLPEPTPMTDAAAIKDKRMLKSSITELNARYNKHGHLSNIISSIMAVQKAAVSVTEIENERVDTIMGSSDIFSVRLVPVVGDPSSIKIRVPALDDTGVFVANGTKYKLRSQKGDYKSVYLGD